MTTLSDLNVNTTTECMIEGASSGQCFTLAHFSDPHIARVERIQPLDFFSKRLFGYLRWKLKRQAEHSSELLTILQKDLQRAKPDHMVVTGDLTQLGLPAEFEAVRSWLQDLGPADRVTVIPGNHDTYVKTPWQHTFRHWLDYMEGDCTSGSVSSIAEGREMFPTLRIRGRLALIGINTACPTSVHLATGTIGNEQLDRLETLLKELAGQDLFRVILIHHPPVQGIVRWRKGLTDVASLEDLLKLYGAELLLFGHTHNSVYANLDRSSNVIPVIGASSVSSISPNSVRRSRYYLYQIASTSNGWHVHLNERIFSLEKWSFVDGVQQQFSLPGKVSSGEF